MKNILALFAIITGLLVTASCPVAIEGKVNFSVSGTISYTLSSYPSYGLPGVDVLLQGADSSVTAVTDSSGNYSFSGIVKGDYTIIPQKTGWSIGTLEVMVDRDLADQDIEAAGAIGGYSIDPWGFVWDGTKRAAAIYSVAQQICSDIGGRLPTPTEIYRNNDVTGSGVLENANDTSWLWTCIEYDQTNMTVVRLSDGSVSNAMPSSACGFRCVWPDADPDAFTGSNVNVNRLVSEEPFEVTINGNRFVMDTMDRAPLPYNAAIREAKFYHAYVPTLSYYTAAIKAGLPNGSNAWVMTSDQIGYDSTNFRTGMVKWSGVSADFQATTGSGSIAYDYLSMPHHFRCIGWKTKPLQNTYTSQIPGAITWGDTGGACMLRSVENDLGGIGVTLVDAINTCFNDGGHLPTEQEYMYMILSGLPNGSSNGLWSSDYETGNYVGLIKWTGVQPDFTGYYGAFSTYSIHTSLNKFGYRPVYYPIDSGYAGPVSTNLTTCPKGLYAYSKALGNGTVIRIWIDNEERDAQAFHLAVKDCYDSGGHLATRRDLVELIRNGLPNGSGNWIWTSDMAENGKVEAIRWTGIDTAFDDQDYGEDGSDTDTGGSPLGYRCVWTNELRIP